jgi:hypothetical protein
MVERISRSHVSAVSIVSDPAEWASHRAGTVRHWGCTRGLSVWLRYVAPVRHVPSGIPLSAAMANTLGPQKRSWVPLQSLYKTLTRGTPHAGLTALCAHCDQRRGLHPSRANIYRVNTHALALVGSVGVTVAAEVLHPAHGEVVVVVGQRSAPPCSCSRCACSG